jgi:hypothetical protein
MAWSVDRTRFAKQLLFAGHFALYLLAVIVYTIHATGAAPPQWSKALSIIAGILGTLGYGLGAAWSPPRRPWTNEERVANGLPPLPPPIPPLPPAISPPIAPAA